MAGFIYNKCTELEREKTITYEERVRLRVRVSLAFRVIVLIFVDMIEFFVFAMFVFMAKLEEGNDRH